MKQYTKPKVIMFFGLAFFYNSFSHHSLLAPTWTAFSDDIGQDLYSAQRFSF